MRAFVLRLLIIASAFLFFIFSGYVGNLFFSSLVLFISALSLQVCRSDFSRRTGSCIPVVEADGAARNALTSSSGRIRCRQPGTTVIKICPFRLDIRITAGLCSGA
jgi:hypothetical protein